MLRVSNVFLPAGHVNGKVVIGHSIWNDLSGEFIRLYMRQLAPTFCFEVLGIPHPAVGKQANHILPSFHI